ncbi:hypothetical protein ILUMI_01232 [Ignelater luminosus]|uniref:Cleft lip and palate associated transmembrane protein n=1 Tax=Ignelater luminosus TaxID=2038154 RepID=A0A8K0GMG0_IGNLU|nr:hypothetical protein ILUMI_01232 [Ignelater luminosus]
MSENTNENGVAKNVVATQDSSQEAAGDASPNAVANQAQQQRQPTKLESFLAITKSLIVRALIIYFITSFFRGRPQQPSNSTAGGTGPPLARNMFENGTKMCLYIYLTDNQVHNSFDPENLFWTQPDLVYGDWTSGKGSDGVYAFESEFPVTEHIKNNGSVYLHAYLTRQGESPDPKAQNYGRNRVCHTKVQLNKFKKLKISGTKNLLTGETGELEKEEGKIVAHWHPNITINLVTDFTHWTQGTVPAPLDEHIKFTDDGRLYKPVLFANDFWNMAKDYKPLNESLSLHITFQPIGLFKWQLYAAQSVRQKWNLFGDTEGEQTDEEQDTLKEALLETNPYLLGLTMIVSVLHSVFELLAFKNDIQFWNNRSSLEGLSVRSVLFGVFQALIVLLYVLDNETNTIIRISCFVGLGIELWKINKVVDIKFENGRIQFKDKGSYVESSTRQYDELAFKYLSWVCFPLLLGYGVYSLLYLEHKGWYSFVLGMLYGFLLTFGFIMMTPQLFINYKLKSVAHLPWRMLTYKFLNTFIDDMFAFVIKMPTMYRIGCFRDDIIFIVFLYQRWIYRVDKTRRNEFGYTGEQQESQGNAIEDKKTQ